MSHSKDKCVKCKETILKKYFKDANEKIIFLPQSMEYILIQKHLKYLAIKTDRSD